MGPEVDIWFLFGSCIARSPSLVADDKHRATLVAYSSR